MLKAQPWNGKISDQQLSFLDITLQDAGQKGQNVLIFCHFPVLEGCARSSHLLLNHAEVVRVIREHADSVVAVFAGHDHFGGYATDYGVHYLTFPGMVEANDNAFAVLTICSDSVEIDIEGYGRVQSQTLLRNSRVTYPSLHPRVTGHEV